MEERQSSPITRTVAEDLWSRWTRMWNGDPELAREIIAEGFYAHLTSKRHADPAELRSAGAVIKWVEKIRAQYAELRYETNGAVLVDGDTLVARWLASGIFAGRTALPGDVPGRPFRVAGTDVLRIEGGRIRECWTLSNYIEP